MPGETGGVNEGLGEGAYGRVRGEGVEWRGVEGERSSWGGMPGCHGVSGGETAEADLETKLRRGDSERVFFSPAKRGTISNKLAAVFSAVIVSSSFGQEVSILFFFVEKVRRIISPGFVRVGRGGTRDGETNSSFPRRAILKIPECSRRGMMSLFHCSLVCDLSQTDTSFPQVWRKVEQW